MKLAPAQFYRFLIAVSDRRAYQEFGTHRPVSCICGLGGSASSLLSRAKIVKHAESVTIQVLGRELPQTPRFGF
jgi:hypothetical protein